MNITDQEDFSVFLKLFNHHFGMIYGRMQLLIWINPLPIKVNSSQITSCIAINDTIRVQHWYDFEYEVVAEDPRSQARPYQIVNNALDHK